jgi:hypothetical protein
VVSEVTQGGAEGGPKQGAVVFATPAADLPPGLVEDLLDGPVLRPERIAAGERRVAGGPVDPGVLADAVVAEAWRGATPALAARG